MAGQERLDIRELAVETFTDVVGDVPLYGKRPRGGFPDYDAALHVDHTDGRWTSQAFDISQWPSAAGRGLALTAELRAQQLDHLGRIGIPADPEEARLAAARIAASPADLAELRHYERAVVRSVAGQFVVGVANSNPRTQDQIARQAELQQHGEKTNGSKWHKAMTTSGVLVVGQAPYLRDVRDRRLVVPGSFERLSEQDAVAAGIWRDKEQFTSRKAVQAATDYPELWAPAPLYGPESPVGDSKAFNTVLDPDRFGNVPISVTERDFHEVAAAIRDNVGAKGSLRITTANGNQAVVDMVVAECLQAGQHDKLNIYLNAGLYPHDEPLPEDHPGIIDVVVPTDKPNDPDVQSAYARLWQAVKNVEPRFHPSDWDDARIDVVIAGEHIGDAAEVTAARG